MGRLRVAPEVVRGFEAGPDGLELIDRAESVEKEQVRVRREAFRGQRIAAAPRDSIAVTILQPNEWGPP